MKRARGTNNEPTAAPTPPTIDQFRPVDFSLVYGSRCQVSSPLCGRGLLDGMGSDLAAFWAALGRSTLDPVGPQRGPFRSLGEQDVTWWAASYVGDLAASKLTTSTHRPMRMRA